MHIYKRKFLTIDWYLKIHEGMVGTIALTGFFLLRPADEFTVIVCSRSLDSLSAYRKMSLFGNRYSLRSGYCCNRQQ